MKILTSASFIIEKQFEIFSCICYLLSTTPRRGVQYVFSNHQAMMPESKSTDPDANKLQMPIMTHLSDEQFNKQQEETNAKLQFSQNGYVDLNCAHNIDSLTTLVAVLILNILNLWVSNKYISKIWYLTHWLEFIQGVSLWIW